MKDALLARMAVALYTVDALRRAIEENGNRYTGMLSPNLQSVADVLTLPEDIFREQLATLEPQHPGITPTVEQLAELERMLAIS